VIFHYLVTHPSTGMCYSPVIKGLVCHHCH